MKQVSPGCLLHVESEDEIRGPYDVKLSGHKFSAVVPEGQNIMEIECALELSSPSIRSKPPWLYVFLSRSASGAVCGVRLYRTLFIAFSSILHCIFETIRRKEK